MVISFVSQKGGCGKTTLALNLAGELAGRGKTLFVDCDAQASGRDWYNLRGEKGFVLSKWTRADVGRFIENRPGFDYVLIDTPSGLNDRMRSAIAASDLAIIPVQPSALDIWSALMTVRELSSLLRARQAVFVLNRKIVNTRLADSAREKIEKFGLPVLKTEISQRVVFAQSVFRGQTVREMQPGRKAAREILALTEEILALEGKEGPPGGFGAGGAGAAGEGTEGEP